MRLMDNKVILRDMVESDIDDRIRWETVETEWQQWDAPWEYDDKYKFDADEYRKSMMQKIKIIDQEADMTYSFQICINDSNETHIGWINIYHIDENYNYTHDDKMVTIGIDIPDTKSRKKGYATSAWILLINYILDHKIKDIYTQTWSGNYKLIGLATKLGFEECNRNRNAVTVRGEKYDDLTFKLNIDNFNLFKY